MDDATIAALRALAASATAAADKLAAAPQQPDPAPAPNPAPTPETPGPVPAPQPVEPVVVPPIVPPVVVVAPPVEPPAPPPKSFTFPAAPIDTSSWRVGAPVKLPIAITGWDKVSFVTCRGDERSTWTGQIRAISTVNLVAIDFTPNEVGGFVKVWPGEGFADVALQKDGPRVPASAMPAPVAPEPVVIPDLPPVLQPQPIPAPAPSVPAGPATGAALARAMKARAGIFTVNWERERFVRNFKYTPEVDAYYTELGIGGVRAFVCWDPSGVRQPDGSYRNYWDFSVGIPPTKEQFNRYRANAEKIVAAGKVFYFDFLDVVGLEDWKDSLRPTVERYIDDACGWVLEWQLDPGRVVYGAANEWAGATNAEYHAQRIRLLEIMRRRLPEPHVLGTAPCYWGHPASFVGERVNGIDLGRYDPGPDAATIHFWHAYERRSAGGWASWQAKMDAWERANDRVIMCGEVGAGGINDGADFLAGDGGWCSHIERQNPAIANSVPALWACTTGHWMMNRSASDPRFYNASQIPAGGSKPWDPPLEQTIRAAMQRNRAARGL